MINIRSNTFETNSSSSHSIVINHTGTQVDDYNTLDIKDGVYTISGGLEFGRAPFRLLVNVRSKLRFVLASLANDYCNGPAAFLTELTEVCKKHYPKLEAIKITAKDWNNDIYYGDIDHQSSGLLNTFMSKHRITYEDFIFDPKYIVVIDGDEYDEYVTLIDIGLIDTNNFNSEEVV